MRLKIREMVLSEETSKKLRQDMSENFGCCISFNTAQGILDSDDNYEIRKTENKINPYSSLYPESIVINRNFELGIKSNGEFIPLYNLYPDKEGVLYQIFKESDYMITERNPHYIGEGEYVIYYKESIRGKVIKFFGVCENFNTNGVSAFWNKEKEQMLLVEYQDIVGLYPVED